jgi:hypothetical protein
MQDDLLIDSLAAEHRADPAAVRRLLDDLRARAGAAAFYVFWIGGGGGGAPKARRLRTLVAFPTPDGALAFAQRNRMAEPGQPPRLRRLTLTQLVGAVLREPAIAGLLLAEADSEPAGAGRLPPGVLLERDELLARLGSA